nr:MAG TPA_asm: tail completion protein [Caudoviricetes sp.]
MIGKLKDLITNGIFAYTGRLAIDTDNNNPRPDYPYYSYKITSIKTNANGEGNYIDSFPESTEEGFKHDYVESVELQPQVIVSFNAYSQDIAECINKISQAWDYFKHAGKKRFADENIVIVRVMNITDRTVVMGERYEYRYGFDVEFRILHTIERRSETIEEFKFNKKGNVK